MLATDLAIATVIACAVLLPRSGTAKLFSNRPLCAIGLVSYGIYLWHFPCFLWLDERVTGLHGAALLVLRAATTLAAPALSYVSSSSRFGAGACPTEWFACWSPPPARERSRHSWRRVRWGRSCRGARLHPSPIPWR
jgi:peptidoglycan/LPS O-acetylase OafA/YrhL